MPLVLFCRFFGWVFARLPESCAKVTCVLLGDLIYFLPGRRSRRRAGLVNLSYAFPGQSEAWRRKICRESCRRLVELTLYVLVTPHLPAERIRRVIGISPEAAEEIKRHLANKQGGVAIIPHITLFEAMNCLPALVPETKGFGAVYRPFKNQHFNDWVKSTRARWGVRLLSRKEGFIEAMSLVRGGGWIGILFDQNAGNSGSLITLFGRTASATDLPGLICKRFQAPGLMVWPERTGFWRSVIRHEALTPSDQAVDYTIASNRWLERYLSSSDGRASDWMWTHRRWGHGKNLEDRFNLKVKKDLRPAFSPDGTIRRGTRYWFWLPADPSEAAELKPLLAHLRTVRPDCAFTLLGSAAVLETFRASGLAEEFLPLPQGWPKEFFASLALLYPDTVFVLDPSPAAARLAGLTEADFILGFALPGGKKPKGLTHAHPRETTPSTPVARLKLWRGYFEQWGLEKDS